eukprot:NODE_2079_length_459_cov_125.641463_g2000_i0.p3 GENE.NODE_2079_length_459_cov_125.641463_g2000_i0~~NODE_2079_length_459_cov_125.641463_g2000_i0.p3  ORF type:complete len:64 (+),score=10.97 NODE_2079_length_459_cov_125.641463_g2000_i0:97-288(+)
MEVAVERKRRMGRALDLKGRMNWMPREMWTRPDDDVAYLTPYIHMVCDEHTEQDQWPVDKFSR